PYARGLLASIPVTGLVKDRLDTIPGSVPNLIDLPPGCKFAPRCQARVENSLDICTEQEPNLIEYKPGHRVRCWLYEQLEREGED
ncbi:MAG: ABC transporter ATP-binding protein, partial [Anaerolineae bacterium]|nr:ABC transporter ATP-binding protein [Anaerolineae bacterium]